MIETPNYYAIIPANVRYSKDINANEKLLFAEITSLSNSTGICWASNTYFSKLFDCTPQAISKWVKNLERNGFIVCEYTYKQGTKEVDKRLIRCINIYLEGINNGIKGINHSLGGYQHTIKDNNININNKKINKKNEIVEYLKTLNLEKINKKSLNEWLDYKNWDYKRLGINKILSFLDNYSFEVQQEIVDNSIMNNYKGLFEPKGNNKKLNSNSNDTDEWTVV